MDFYANDVVAMLEADRRIRDLRAEMTRKPGSLPFLTRAATAAAEAVQRFQHALAHGMHRPQPKAG